MNKKEIFKMVEIGYRKGFLDGLNYEEEQVGDEITTEAEFNNSEIKKIIDLGVEKTIRDNNL